MQKRLHLIITGKVQDVNFRYFTQKKAQELTLTGYVKNLDNGCVEVVAEGEENNLLQLTKFCKIGPRLAKVENIKDEFSEATNQFNNFKIQY
tara:strand:- start:46 stop:321 length:276 start_codon:yes stop_codon:yes gene_type:complete